MGIINNLAASVRDSSNLTAKKVQSFSQKQSYKQVLCHESSVVKFGWLLLLFCKNYYFRAGYSTEVSFNYEAQFFIHTSIFVWLENNLCHPALRYHNTVLKYIYIPI